MSVGSPRAGASLDRPRPGPPDVRDSFFGRPLVPAAIAFVAGILSISSPWVFGFSLTGFLLMLKTRAAPPIAIALTAAFWGIGAARGAISSGPAPGDISRWIGQGSLTVRGSVASEPEGSTHATSLILRAREVLLRDGAVIPCRGMILLRIPPEFGALDYADGLEVRGALQRPEGTENPGLFRYPEYLARMGVFSSLSVRRASAVKRLAGSRRGWDRVSRAVQMARLSMIAEFDRRLPPIEAHLLAGIVLGQRTRLPAELKDDFAASGTSHILASSGMNVGIVAAMTLWVARLCRIRKSRAVALIIPALFLYTLLAGAKPSVVRADIMATVFFLAWALKREPDMASAIALAALGILVWEPRSIYDPGFQLSFAAVIALVACMPLFQPSLSAALGQDGGRAPAIGRIKHLVIGGILLSLVAQVAALPLTAQHFNQIPILAIPANALILLIIPLLLYGGFALWAGGFIAAPLMSPLASVLSGLIAYVLGVATVLGAAPLSVLSVPSPGWALVAAFYAALGWVIWRFGPRPEVPERP